MTIKRKSAALRLAAVMLPLLALSGCYEEISFDTHKPGAYKGKRDSNAVMHPSDEQRTALVQRFRAVQTDR